jgi:hypothetical protein
MVKIIRFYVPGTNIKHKPGKYVLLEVISNQIVEI